MIQFVRLRWGIIGARAPRSFPSTGLFAALLMMSMFGVNSFAAAAPGYNRDIRPILSDNCFFCHGPDANKRKGKLRLDVREDAVSKKAIVPGEPEESELVKRIFAKDPDDLMPPAETHKTLSAAQKELLRQWIKDGARYEGHWAYIPPTKAHAPTGTAAIDFLIRERLKQVGLTPSREADRRTVVRRLYFDLTGLPPTPDEAAAYERDTRPDDYEKLVEKLLASPQYGERMAIGWLDLVRFADTIGYHSDNPRNIWPYRDYVIRAFNENKRFDAFTKEQIAGDLLPGSGQEQKVASAFNRLLLSTEEGGAQPKDYEARMLTDRVRAIGTVWLGQTIGCAQCHDHKFDPIKAKDFYSMGAFFADIKEAVIGRREDGMLVPNPLQETELARLVENVKRFEKDYDGAHPELQEAFAAWEKKERANFEQNQDWKVLKPSKVASQGGSKLRVQPDSSVLAQDKNPEKDNYTLTFTNFSGKIAGLRVEALPHDSLPAKGPGRAANGNFVLTEVVTRVLRGDGSTQVVSFASARASIEQTDHAAENPYKAWSASAAIDHDAKGERWGWAILPQAGQPNQILLQAAEGIEVGAADKLIIELRQYHGDNGHNLGYFRISTTPSSAALSGPFVFPPSGELAELLAVAPEKRDQSQRDKLFAHFKTVAPQLERLRKDLASARKSRSDFEGSLPRCLVSVSDKPRTVRILPRGNFLVETGDIVQPALPGYLKQSEGDRKLTRLDLAEWLVAKENPLTARVVVNRFWKQFFGTGLSKVLDDFGAQGEVPPNQALLDWLAAEFMESGWDVKHMVRLMVSSQAYRQVSTMSETARARDPFNREFSAQNRWRLEAELVRDNALAVAGMLSLKVGGPSVKPYQPDGYWENLNFPQRTWEKSTGENQYRRGLYTWWQRSFVQPSLLAFDAPSREECVAERNRSNIPQQALVLLNDPTYVEAARVFAARILREGQGDTEARLKWAWRRALLRTPRAEELQTMKGLLERSLAEYKTENKDADALLTVGLKTPSEGVDHAELAAWTQVARVILNLHETITRS